MTVETASWSSGFLPNDDNNWPYAVLARSREQAADNIAYSGRNYEPDPEAFVEQTGFDQSYLILIEYAYASGTDSLILKRIERRDHGLDVTAKVYRPGNGSSDAKTHSLFIRVTEGNDDPPQEMTVEVIE
jgi:hypothetical protein